MPRRSPLALTLLAVLGLAGCGSEPKAVTGNSVPVAAVNGLASSTLIACRAFKATVPVEIAPGATQRPASPLSDTTTAWGTPAITSRCGVKEGSALDDPYTFNEVRWAMHDNGSSRLWTTVGRKVNVVIEVPDDYSSQAELIGKLADGVKKYLS